MEEIKLVMIGDCYFARKMLDRYTKLDNYLIVASIHDAQLWDGSEEVSPYTIASDLGGRVVTMMEVAEHDED